MNCKFFFIYWLKEAVSNSLKLPLALVFFFSDTVENFKSKSYKRGSSLSMYISNVKKKKEYFILMISVTARIIGHNPLVISCSNRKSGNWLNLGVNKGKYV